MDPYNTPPKYTPAPDLWRQERTRPNRLLEALEVCPWCGNTHRNPGNARYCPDTGEP
jgi:hypothetical protein